jgi:hypothetical protein
VNEFSSGFLSLDTGQVFLFLAAQNIGCFEQAPPFINEIGLPIYLKFYVSFLWRLIRKQFYGLCFHPFSVIHVSNLTGNFYVFSYAVRSLRLVYFVGS